MYLALKSPPRHNGSTRAIRFAAINGWPCSDLRPRWTFRWHRIWRDPGQHSMGLAICLTPLMARGAPMVVAATEHREPFLLYSRTARRFSRHAGFLQRLRHGECPRYQNFGCAFRWGPLSRAARKSFSRNSSKRSFFYGAGMRRNLIRSQGTTFRTAGGRRCRVRS